MTCFECDASSHHMHHVVPRSRGGLRVIPLCSSCHEKAHDVSASRLTSDSMRRKARRGEYIGGGTPFGYRLAGDGVRLVPDDDEQAVIMKARDMRLDGFSLRAVSSALDLVGMRARNGKPFAPVQIARMSRHGGVA